MTSLFNTVENGFNKVGEFVKKELGFDDVGEHEYTTDYNYMKNIPPPCNYYNTKKPGYCCTSDEINNKSSDCKLCGPDAVKNGKCNFIHGDIKKKDWNTTSVNTWFDELMKTTESVSNYKDLVLPGDEDSNHIRLGSRYFISNGLQCIDSTGKKVEAYNYINNIPLPPGPSDLSNSMLDTLEEFNIDKIIYNSGTVDKLGNMPKCVNLSMPVGIYPSPNEQCSNHNSKIKNEKCHIEKKPIIVSFS